MDEVWRLAGQPGLPAAWCSIFALLDMMFLHDNSYPMNESTLTERGQISLPASLRRALRLRPGQKLRFEPVSDHEFRVFTPREKVPGPLAVLGYGRRLGAAPRRTKDWMKELRQGEG